MFMYRNLFNKINVYDEIKKKNEIILEYIKTL